MKTPGEKAGDKDFVDAYVRSKVDPTNPLGLPPLKKDVSDTADSSGWPSPWSKGSYTWSIPVSWRLKGAATSTAFSANNNQVATITGTDGTTVVTKLGAKTDPRKPSPPSP